MDVEKMRRKYRGIKCCINCKHFDYLDKGNAYHDISTLCFYRRSPVFHIFADLTKYKMVDWGGKELPCDFQWIEALNPGKQKNKT